MRTPEPHGGGDLRAALLGSGPEAGEIGLRIALGAGRREGIGMVLRQAGQLVAAGIVLGVVGGAGAQRLLKSIFFGVRAGDPVFLPPAGAVTAAAYLPAWRAASVDPMQALRSE